MYDSCQNIQTESIDIHAQSIMMANFEKEMLRDRELARKQHEERARQARALAMNSFGKSLHAPINDSNSSELTFPTKVENGHVAKENECKNEEETEAMQNKEQ